MPYLEGFPPDDELPTFEWVRKTAAVVVRVLLGAVRQAGIHSKRKK